MSKGTVIARGGLDLRRAPKSRGTAKTLRRGTGVEILGEERWLRVRTADGHTGYVLADFVEREPAAATMPEGFAQAIAAGFRPLEVAPSAACMIEPYHNTQFAGAEVRADVDFFPLLDRVNDYAKECGVGLHVVSSYRDPDRKPSGAIVPPASRSNHFIGHAIDMNVTSGSGFFNSKKLARANLPNLPAEVRRFIEKIRNDPDLRWGGDFRPEDPVHIDDGLNKIDLALWESKLSSLA
ncbi:MAG: M15 family metallopeptidase [Geminicoccaceae bacterium]